MEDLTHSLTDTRTLDVARLCSVRGIQRDYKVDHIQYVLITLCFYECVPTAAATDCLDC